MANEWYYAKDGQQQGPVSAKELKQLADAGRLHGGDLVWKEGMPDWKPASEVKGLIGGTAPPSTSGGGGVVVSDTVASPGRRGRSRHRSPLGQVMLIVAGVLLIGQMCVPWWSLVVKDAEDSPSTSGAGGGMKVGNVIGQNAPVLAFQERGRNRFRRRLPIVMPGNISGRQLVRLIAHGSNADFDLQIKVKENIVSSSNSSPDRKQKAQKEIKFLKIAKKDRKWWKEHLKSGDKSLEDRMLETVDDDTATFRIWGWHEGYSIMGLVFGIVIMVFSIVFISVPPMRNWSWIVSILATIFGIIILIFSLIWIFTAPGQDASPEFRQGIIIGPYLLLAGGVMFLLVGIFDMIAGLAFQSRLRRLRAQA